MSGQIKSIHLCNLVSTFNLLQLTVSKTNRNLTSWVNVSCLSMSNIHATWKKLKAIADFICGGTQLKKRGQLRASISLREKYPSERSQTPSSGCVRSKLNSFSCSGPIT